MNNWEPPLQCQRKLVNTIGPQPYKHYFPLELTNMEYIGRIINILARGVLCASLTFKEASNKCNAHELSPVKDAEACSFISQLLYHSFAEHRDFDTATFWLLSDSVDSLKSNIDSLFKLRSKYLNYDYDASRLGFSPVIFANAKVILECFGASGKKYYKDLESIKSQFEAHLMFQKRRMKFLGWTWDGSRDMTDETDGESGGDKSAASAADLGVIDLPSPAGFVQSLSTQEDEDLDSTNNSRIVLQKAVAISNSMQKYLDAPAKTQLIARLIGIVNDLTVQMNECVTTLNYDEANRLQELSIAVDRSIDADNVAASNCDLAAAPAGMDVESWMEDRGTISPDTLLGRGRLDRVAEICRESMDIIANLNRLEQLYKTHHDYTTSQTLHTTARDISLRVQMLQEHQTYCSFLADPTIEERLHHEGSKFITADFLFRFVFVYDSQSVGGLVVKSSSKHILQSIQQFWPNISIFTKKIAHNNNSKNSPVNVAMGLKQTPTGRFGQQQIFVNSNDINFSSPLPENKDNGITVSSATRAKNNNVLQSPSPQVPWRSNGANSNVLQRSAEEAQNSSLSRSLVSPAPYTQPASMQPDCATFSPAAGGNYQTFFPPQSPSAALHMSANSPQPQEQFGALRPWVHSYYNTKKSDRVLVLGSPSPSGSRPTSASRSRNTSRPNSASSNGRLNSRSAGTPSNSLHNTSLLRGRSESSSSHLSTRARSTSPTNSISSRRSGNGSRSNSVGRRINAGSDVQTRSRSNSNTSTGISQGAGSLRYFHSRGGASAATTALAVPDVPSSAAYSDSLYQEMRLLIDNQAAMAHTKLLHRLLSYSHDLVHLKGVADNARQFDEMRRLETLAMALESCLDLDDTMSIRGENVSAVLSDWIDQSESLPVHSLCGRERLDGVRRLCDEAVQVIGDLKQQAAHAHTVRDFSTAQILQATAVDYQAVHAELTSHIAHYSILRGYLGDQIAHEGSANIVSSDFLFQLVLPDGGDRDAMGHRGGDGYNIGSLAIICGAGTILRYIRLHWPEFTVLAPITNTEISGQDSSMIASDDITENSVFHHTDDKYIANAFTDASKLRLMGFDVMTLRSAGFTDTDILTSGFNAVELHAGGFDTKSMRTTSHLSDATLRAVGLDSVLHQEALQSFFDQTNGEGWKCSKNWMAISSAGSGNYGQQNTSQRRITHSTTFKNVSAGVGAPNTSAVFKEEERPFGVGFGVDDAGTSGTIISINLPNNNLRGVVPDNIGVLTTLVHLVLNSNRLEGAIPSTIGQLHSLKSLFLYNNNLCDSIPQSIGDLNQLCVLRLEGNQLNGRIPPSICRLTSLRRLVLNDNRLSGRIPHLIGLMSSLQELILHNNMLTGPIPESVSKLAHLNTMLLNDNQLSGEIVQTVSQLQHLTAFQVQNNGDIRVDRLLLQRWLPKCRVKIDRAS